MELTWRTDPVVVGVAADEEEDFGLKKKKMKVAFDIFASLLEALKAAPDCYGSELTEPDSFGWLPVKSATVKNKKKTVDFRSRAECLRRAEKLESSF